MQTNPVCRFELEYSTSLNEALQALGVTKPFEGGDITQVCGGVAGATRWLWMQLVLLPPACHYAHSDARAHPQSRPHPHPLTSTSTRSHTLTCRLRRTARGAR